jgi:hypothetical protein
LALDLVGVECVLFSDEMVGALWTEEAFDAGGDAPALGLGCWFWFFAVFCSTVCDGQHQNPSGVTAIGTFLNFVARGSRPPTLNSAILLEEAYEEWLQSQQQLIYLRTALNRSYIDELKLQLIL